MEIGLIQGFSIVSVFLWCDVSVTADCVGLPVVEHASSNVTGSSPYAEGMVLEFSCNLGYTTSGTSRYYTCSGTEWTGGNIVCDPILCPYIAPPDNGYYANTPIREAGTEIIFACNEGHDMSGNSILTCRTDGNWSPASSAPTCTPKDCGEFGTILHGETFQDTTQQELNHYGSVVRVTCKYGYIIIGSPNVECQADGTWGTKPTCEEITCPPYPNLNSSCISKVEKLGSSYLVILCKEGNNTSVTKTGGDRAECLSSGEWDSLDLACFCDCFVGGDLNKVSFTNLNALLFLPHGQSLQWGCTSGTKREDVNFLCSDGQFRVTSNGTVTLTSYLEVHGYFNIEEAFCKDSDTTVTTSTVQSIKDSDTSGTIVTTTTVKSDKDSDTRNSTVTTKTVESGVKKIDPKFLLVLYLLILTFATCL